MTPVTDPNWRTSRSGGRCTISRGLESLPSPRAGVRSKVASTFHVPARLVAHASRNDAAASRRDAEFGAGVLSRRRRGIASTTMTPRAAHAISRAGRPGDVDTGFDGTARSTSRYARDTVSPMIEVVALDGDDTLWHNELQFSMTQARFCELVAPDVPKPTSMLVCSRPSGRTSRPTATASSRSPCRCSRPRSKSQRAASRSR